MIKLHILQNATVFEQHFTDSWSKVHFYRREALHYQIDLLRVQFSVSDRSDIMK